MNFWKKFASSEKDSFLISLHEKLHKLFPDAGEEKLVRLACVSGLMARVAYVDFEIHTEEERVMKEALDKWTDLIEDERSAVAKIAIEEIKDLAGMEDHLYTRELVNLTSSQERYEFLEVLFQIAASDGGVESKEEEEIRQISTGLKLGHKHFISARAQVLEYLNNLK